MRNVFPRDPAPEAVASAPLANRRFEALARSLEVLSSEPRLELLHALRTPKALHEIRVTAGFTREGENPDRPISRQAVARHIEQLVDAGLVRRLAPDEEARGDRYVLSHDQVFALVDAMRGLARIQPLLPDDVSLAATIDKATGSRYQLAPRPRLLVAYGRDDGISYGLDPSMRSWRVGRAHGCDVRLDYDPYLSSENSQIERSGTSFAISDLGSRNGTWLNWQRVTEGEERALVSGDLVCVGRSVLVFQS